MKFPANSPLTEICDKSGKRLLSSLHCQGLFFILWRCWGGKKITLYADKSLLFLWTNELWQVSSGVIQFHRLRTWLLDKRTFFLIFSVSVSFPPLLLSGWMYVWGGAGGNQLRVSPKKCILPSLKEGFHAFIKLTGIIQRLRWAPSIMTWSFDTKRPITTCSLVCINKYAGWSCTNENK